MILHRSRLFLNQKKHVFVPILLAPILEHFQEFFFLAFHLNRALTIDITPGELLQAITVH